MSAALKGGDFRGAECKRDAVDYLAVEESSYIICLRSWDAAVAWPAELGKSSVSHSGSDETPRSVILQQGVMISLSGGPSLQTHLLQKKPRDFIENPRTGGLAETSGSPI